jgi:hypothetical protein
MCAWRSIECRRCEREDETRGWRFPGKTGSDVCLGRVGGRPHNIVKRPQINNGTVLLLLPGIYSCCLLLLLLLLLFTGSFLKRHAEGKSLKTGGKIFRADHCLRPAADPRKNLVTNQ